MSTNALLETIASLLKEAEVQSKEVKSSVDEAVYSIDGQVRKYLEDALKNSKKVNESYDWDMSRMQLEADEEKSDEKQNEGIEKMTLDDVNVGSYSSAVVRLIDNFDNLIDVYNASLVAARHVLGESCDDDVLEVFDEVLDEKYSMSVESSKWDKEIEDQPPFAVGSGKSTE